VSGTMKMAHSATAVIDEGRGGRGVGVGAQHTHQEFRQSHSTMTPGALGAPESAPRTR
jgi:hypothetical protein